MEEGGKSVNTGGCVKHWRMGSGRGHDVSSNFQNEKKKGKEFDIQFNGSLLAGKPEFQKTKTTLVGGDINVDEGPY